MKLLLERMSSFQVMEELSSGNFSLLLPISKKDGSTAGKR